VPLKSERVPGAIQPRLVGVGRGGEIRPLHHGQVASGSIESFLDPPQGFLAVLAFRGSCPNQGLRAFTLLFGSNYREIRHP
jgi:hypothetical protein